MRTWLMAVAAAVVVSLFPLGVLTGSKLKQAEFDREAKAQSQAALDVYVLGINQTYQMGLAYQFDKQYAGNVTNAILEKVRVLPPDPCTSDRDPWRDLLNAAAKGEYPTSSIRVDATPASESGVGIKR